MLRSIRLVCSYNDYQANHNASMHVMKIQVIRIHKEMAVATMEGRKTSHKYVDQHPFWDEVKGRENQSDLLT